MTNGVMPVLDRMARSQNIAVALVLLLCLNGGQEAAAQSRVSTTAAQFLTIGTGARGSALGHAYTASATGADALYWNPAGVARTDAAGNRGAVFFSNTQWLMEIDYNAFGLTVPVTRSGVAGLSIAMMDYGRMPVTTVNMPDGTGESFGAMDLVAGLSYAQPLTDMFYIGGTFKYVRQNIYDMSAGTVAFDIGFVLDSPYLNGLRLGASIMNFGGQMQMRGVNARRFITIDPQNSGSNDKLPAHLHTDSWDLPLSFKFGAALPVVRTNSVRLELLADAQQTNDNNLNADFGAELRFLLGNVTFDLRGGYKDFPLTEVDNHLTLGGGLDLRFTGIRIGADFGFMPFDALGSVRMLDLRLFF
jgi:hypothetical protein